MGWDSGGNHGVTGVIDGPEASGAKWHCWARSFTQELGADQLPDGGRGDGDWPATVPLSSNGGIVVGGKVTLDACPIPEKFQDQPRDLVLTLSVDVTVTYPVIIQKAKFVQDEKTTDGWDFTLTCRVTGRPTFSGWIGTQPTIEAPSFEDKEHWTNLSKTYDPKRLQNADTQQWRFYGTGDNDAAENAKIAAFSATLTEPSTGLKLRPSTLRRLSANVVTFDTTWGLTDTQEDIENPGTHSRIDLAGIASQGIDTAVYDPNDGEPANAASPDATKLKAVGKEITELHDSRFTKATYFDVNDEIEKWLFGATSITTDPSNLKNVTVRGAIYDRDDGEPSDIAPPSDLVLNGKKFFDVTSEDTSNLQGVLWFYSETTSADDEIFPKTRFENDPLHLDSAAITGAIFTTGSPPIDPSAPIGDVKLVAFIDSPLTDASASNQSIRLYRWGTRTSGDDRGFARRHVEIDDNHISDNAISYAIWNTADDPPLAVDHPPDGIGGVTANVKLITFDDHPLVELGETIYLRWFLWGPKDSRDEKILPNYETVTDASGLTSTAARAYLDGESVPSTPSNMVLRDTKDVPVTLGLAVNRTLTVLIFGTRTHEQDITFKSRYVLEAGQLIRETVVIVVTTDSTPDATGLNPDPTNLSLWDSSSSQETDAGKWVHTFTFRPLTATEAMTAEHEGDDIDPAHLDDESTRVLYNTTSTPDAAPSVVGKVHYRTNVRRVGKVKYRYTYKYRYRTSAEMLEALKTKTLIDLSGPESEATTADEWLVSGGAPSDPTLSGFVLVTKADEETDNPLYRLRVYSWGLVTNQQKVEQGSSEAIADPLSVYRSKVSTIISHGGDDDKTIALAAAAANASNIEFVSARCKRIPTSATQALLTLTFTGECNKVHSEQVQSRLYPYRGKPTAGFDDATAFGVTTSYVKAVIPGPTILIGGYDSARIDYTYWERKTGRFMVRMRYLTSSAREPSEFRFEAQRGKVNDDTFLDRPAHTVKFIGAKQIYNGTLNTNHLVVVDLEFETDSQFHMGDQNLPLPGQRYKFYDVSVDIAASGYVDPRIFFGAGSDLCDLYWPSEDDFSVFGIAG